MKRKVGHVQKIKGDGYCHVCSTDVLSFVASLFARGNAKK